MPADYRQFIGQPYEPPHGCLRLVEQVYREAYGIDLRGCDADVADNDSAALYRLLRRLTTPVEDPREGDIVLVRSQPWHVGVVIEPGLMLHSYSGGLSCIENYDSFLWRNRVSGFYRYADSRE